MRWFPDITVRPWRNLDLMIVGLCEIVQGLAAVVMLGYLKPPIAVAYLVWRSKQMMARRKHEN
jgi:hypothetical protein